VAKDPVKEAEKIAKDSAKAIAKAKERDAQFKAAKEKQGKDKE
jgi:hypothetical protein